ncbi:uncharacterized protein G2W53_039812 [Senna tora]|uniref:Uncharacterized protein n=1 Tax=Senna tora TaxID=362788 RepID=A0A834W6G7_9FABA|nr:uncharacterized protein G2W53_039812 [Senna tora]
MEEMEGRGIKTKMEAEESKKKTLKSCELVGEKSKKESEKGDRAADLKQTERELGDFRNLIEKKNGTERENRVEAPEKDLDCLEKHRERGSSSIPLG